MNRYAEKTRKTLLETAQAWLGKNDKPCCPSCHTNGSLSPHISVVEFDIGKLCLKVRALIRCHKCTYSKNELFRSDPIAVWLDECDLCGKPLEYPNLCPPCDREQEEERR